jgi:hypothetical protein
VAVIVIGGTAAVAVEAKHHFIGNALLDMKDSIVLLFKLGKAVVSPLMEELTEDIIEAQKKLALRTLQKDSQDIPGMISSIIGAIHSVTPIDIDLTIPPFSADIPKDIGVTIFPKPILDIPDVESIPATERESNVIIENPPYIPKGIIDIFPEHVNEGDTIIRMDGGNGVGEGSGKTIPHIADAQLGKKLVDHAADYGLTKSKEGAAAYKQIVQDSLKNTTEVRTGTWKTLGECEFWISGNDVSIIKNGTWVSTFPLTKPGTVDYINSLPIVK